MSEDWHLAFLLLKRKSDGKAQERANSDTPLCVPFFGWTLSEEYAGLELWTLGRNRRNSAWRCLDSWQFAPRSPLTFCLLVSSQTPVSSD